MKKIYKLHAGIQLTARDGFVSALQALFRAANPFEQTVLFLLNSFWS